MAQDVQCFNAIASLTPCHSVTSEYSPTQTAEYSVIGSCKILVQSYARITLEWIVMISFLLGGLIKGLIKDPKVRFKFSEPNWKIDGVLWPWIRFLSFRFRSEALTKCRFSLEVSWQNSLLGSNLRGLKKSNFFPREERFCKSEIRRSG